MEKEVFIQESAKMYLRYGIKSVTMDDLARSMGISKKTIYKHVKDKSDLVNQVVDMMLSTEKIVVCKITEVDDNQNAVEELVKISERVSEHIANVHPSVFFDLRKYFAGAWKKIEDHKQTFVKKCVIDNLKKGIKEGLYRKNLEPEIIASLYLGNMDQVFNSETFPTGDFKAEEIYDEFVRYHIRGIASEKGIEFLQTIIKNKSLL